MTQNRSTLSRDANNAILAVAMALVAAAILPVFKGLLVVPIASLGGLALLTFALELLARRQPASETLEFIGDVVRHRDSHGRERASPLNRTRFAPSWRGGDLRLYLETRDGRHEFGLCLGLDERSSLAPVVAGAFADARAQSPSRIVPPWD